MNDCPRCWWPHPEPRIAVYVAGLSYWKCIYCGHEWTYDDVNNRIFWQRHYNIALTYEVFCVVMIGLFFAALAFIGR